MTEQMQSSSWKKSTRVRSEGSMGSLEDYQGLETTEDAKKKAFTKDWAT